MSARVQIERTQGRTGEAAPWATQESVVALLDLLHEQNRRIIMLEAAVEWLTNVGPEPQDTERILYERLREHGCFISGDGRISEKDFAWLIGQSPDTLRNRRRYGDCPQWYRLGGRGHQVSYRVSDIARWLDSLCET